MLRAFALLGTGKLHSSMTAKISLRMSLMPRPGLIKCLSAWRGILGESEPIGGRWSRAGTFLKAEIANCGAGADRTK